ncbi:MAG: hypothetical protein WBM25_08885 [Azonexus sp.]
MKFLEGLFLLWGQRCIEGLQGGDVLGHMRLMHLREFQYFLGTLGR